MESGFRLDNTEKWISRHIVESFDCSYNGREVFRAKLHPAVSTNPFVTFFALVDAGGDFVFTWRNDQGGEAKVTQTIAVTA